MRAGFLTGRYQQRFGYENNVAFDLHNHLMGLPASEPTAADRLKTKGYTSAIMGKWHLGAGAPFRPNRRGFDHFFGFLGGGHDYFAVDANRPTGEGYQHPLQRNAQPASFEGYLTDALSNEAVTFIDQYHEQPFLLYLAYNTPHTPMQAPDAYVERYEHIENKKRRTYAAMVSAMDDGVGRVRDALDRHGLRERTLIMFLSDNGGPVRQGSPNGASNGPLREGKGTVYEGGIRVPCVLAWPGTLPSGSVCQHPVIALDLTATALDAGDALEGAPLDGVSLLPVLTGEDTVAPRTELCWRWQEGDKWAIRQGDWKLVSEPGTEGLELFHLGDDVGERQNLANGEPQRVEALRAAFDAWNAKNMRALFPGFRDYIKRRDAFHRAVEAASQAESEP